MHFEINYMTIENTIAVCDPTERHLEDNCMASEHTRVCFDINCMGPDHTLKACDVTEIHVELD